MKTKIEVELFEITEIIPEGDMGGAAINAKGLRSYQTEDWQFVFHPEVGGWLVKVFDGVLGYMPPDEGRALLQSQDEELRQ